MNFHPERDRRGFDGPLSPQPNENPMMCGRYRPWHVAKVIISTTCVLLACRPGLTDEHATNSVKSTGKGPNIVLIMADDIGVEGLNCYGGTSYRTPRLDQMAAEGQRFTQAYAQPLCTNTRIQLMTGLYNNRNWLYFGCLDPKAKTFGHWMKEAGYNTCIAGKWQL
jgi:hypothetical protein